MGGGVPELAFRNRLRSSDTKVKVREEKKMHSEEEEDEMKVQAKNMTSATILEKEKRREMPTDLCNVKEEVVEMQYGHKQVVCRKASTANSEKGERMEMPIILSDDDEEEKVEMSNSLNKVNNKEEKRMCGGVSKVNNRKEPTATLEKEKKRKMLSSHSGEEKMNRGDHHKDKRRRSTPLPLDKNNGILKKKRKMMSSHSSVKKMHSGDCNNCKRRNMIPPVNKSKHLEKEKKEMLSSHNGEKKMWCSDHDHDKDKKRSMPPPLNRNEMKKNETKKRMTPIVCVAKKKMQLSDRMEMKVENGDNKEKKKNAPHAVSNKNKIQTLTNKKKVNKRKAATMIIKEKKIRTDDRDKMVGGYDRRKEEKKMQGDDKDHKMHSGGKENKRNVPPAFYKVVLNNFEEFLLIPPIIAPTLADLTNRHVYLEDSEGKSSKIRLSVVEGYLAFYQGWKNFVSDHSIEYGDFLLFEYTAMSKFSVRVFGMDCSERLRFNAEVKGSTKKQKESHASDNLVPCHRGGNTEDINGRHYVSGEHLGSKWPETKTDGYVNYREIAPDNLVAKSLNAASGTRHMTVNTKGDPNRVVRGLKHGPSVALANKDGNLANGDCKAKNSSLTCSKEETRKYEIIPVSDASPLTQENEDTVKLTPLKAASGTCHVTANTKEDPKEVASGAWCGSTVTLDKNMGSLAIEEFKTKSISPTCWKQKERSEVIPSVALANKDGNLANGDCRAKNSSLTCSKEETRKYEIIPVSDASPLTQENEDTVKLTPLKAASGTCHVTANTKEDPKEVASGAWCGSSVTLDKNMGSLAIEEFKTKSISPTCWKQKERSEVILITDAAPLEQENDDAVKLTTFSHHKEGTSMIRQSELEVATPTKCTEIHDSDEDIRREHKGNTVQLECTTIVGKCPNNSNTNNNGDVLRKYEAPAGFRCLEKLNKDIMIGQADLEGTVLIRPEKRQKTVKKLIDNCSVMGLNPVEQWSLGSDSTRSWLQPMPVNISKSGHTGTNIDNSVDGEGPVFQLRAKKEELEPVGSIVSRQRNNVPAGANHAVARQSERHFFRQEDVKSSDGVSSRALTSVKAEVQELDGHSVLKTNLQFYIPSTARGWLELANSLPNAIRQKGRQDRSIIILKDPMKRLWPVFYHESSILVGFTRGWQPFVAANNLEIGDLCTLLKDLDEDEAVYHVNITKKRGQC